MKKIFDIFKQDLAKIFKSKIATLILVGIMFIPGIYAWLNIDSNWDPYDNTNNVPIAVTNNDTGTKILDQEINIGNQLVDNLKTNSAMKWTFVDEAEAKTGVESGKYYGAIILPDNFSNKITTLFDGTKIEKPTFDFYVNDKKNPIAPIIVDKAVNAIETNLDQAFVDKIIYQTADKVKTNDLAKDGVDTINRVITRLNETKNHIEQVKTILNVVADATSSTANAFAAVQDLLPSVRNLSSNAKSDLLNLQTNVNSISTIYTEINNNIKNTLQATKELSTYINDALNSITTLSSDYKEKLQAVLSKLDILSSTITNLQRIVSSLKTISNAPELDRLQSKLEETQRTIDNLKTTINNALAGDAAALEAAKSKATQLKNELNDITNLYENKLSQTIGNALNRLSSSITLFINTFGSLSNALTRGDAALSSTINALNSTSNFTVNVNTMLGDLQDNIDKIIEVLANATESELYLKLVNLLQNSPAEIANFISSPFTANKINIYEIDHYGSKMAPFYTILATWVGCTLLVAIMKTDTEEKKGIKPHQAFLGHFLLFGTVAAAQGLIIGLGDIIMQVQVINAPLFLFTIMLSSLVFMLIIYSLVVSFGKIGEAIAVVMMVLQVAGSGGTFLIELLPDFFQKLQPFMPFYPSMGALRETVGGFYDGDYIKYILLLLCHIIIPLLLGLVIRKPIIKFKNKLTHEVEDTGILV